VYGEGGKSNRIDPEVCSNLKFFIGSEIMQALGFALSVGDLGFWCGLKSKKRVLATKIEGRTRIRTGVAWIKTKSDNHYTIQPFTFQKILHVNPEVFNLIT
jgi:hypothetical protein